MRVVPICPECGSEFARQEYLEGWNLTGFCHPCAKHFKMCSATLYMTSCVRPCDHSGNHLTYDACEFVDDGIERSYAVPRTRDAWHDCKVVSETISLDKVKDWKLDTKFVVNEQIGAAVINLLGVANGDKKTVVG
jgi:hypothetical protein